MIEATKRAAATFIFATTGSLVGLNLLDADVAVWKVAVGTGLGALVNLAYRASEGWLKANPE